MTTTLEIKAQQIFVNKLLAEGYDSAEVTTDPTVIVAQKGDETWYYEFVVTNYRYSCFLNPARAECEQAQKTPDRYRFVFAICQADETFVFREYTPAELYKEMKVKEERLRRVYANACSNIQLAFDPEM